MPFSSEKTNITTCLYALSALFLGLTLTACSGGNEAKVVSRHINNGQGEGPGTITKPTPDTGMNVSGFSALGLIALKETTRAIDIALMGEESTRLDKNCQELFPTTSGNVTKLNIKTTRVLCRGNMADETFQVTKDAKNNIQKIERLADNGMQIENNQIRREGSSKININESLVIERIGSTSTFTVNAALTLRLEATSAGDGKRGQRNEKLSSTRITFEGKVELTTPNSPALQITSLQVDYGRLINSNIKPTILSSLSIKQLGNDFLPSVCGVPTGNFNVEQSDGVDENKQTKYETMLATDVTKDVKTKSEKSQLTIINPKTKGIVEKVTLMKCDTTFKDIANVVNLAERMVERVPGLNVPRAGGSPGKGKKSGEEKQASPATDQGT